MSKKLFIVLGIVVLGIGVGLFILLEKLSPDLPGAEQADVPSIQIGFSLGTLQEERWQRGVDNFVKRAGELGATVEVKYSEEDSGLQISQAENLIIGGVKVLVVVPNDSVSANEIVKKAHEAGVKVITYDRMIDGSDVDMYVSFDSREIGRLQAEEVLSKVSSGNIAYIGGASTDNNAFLLKEGPMKVLEPLLKDGKAKLVVDTFTPGWKPEEAYNVIKKYLASGNTLNAVIAANDGTAGGVIKALSEYGLAGVVPVSGQDADLVACQRAVAGTQTMTVYKSLQELAYAAADAAVLLAKGEVPEFNGTINNGQKDVPSYFLNPVLVTKENMDEVIIKGGFHAYEDVYGGSSDN